MESRRLFRHYRLVKTATAFILAATAAFAWAEPQIPEWYEANRVQAHSEHGLEATLEITPERHARIIHELGAAVLTRIFLNREEGAWWPTEVGETNPSIGDRDIAAELVKAAHDRGMKVFAYHRHMCDAAAQEAHPEWICRSLDGSVVYEPRGKVNTPPVLCLNSAYRDFVRTRLLELAARGVDGLYFDSWHMPEVCACPACREKFLAATGHGMKPNAERGSPAYLDISRFVNGSMVGAFEQWQTAVSARYPGTMFAVGSSRFPMFQYPQIDSRLLAISYPSKTEFHKPFGGNWTPLKNDPDFEPPAWDIQTALGWSLVRDSSYSGCPPLTWLPYLRREWEALYSTAAVVSYGGVASLSISLNRPTQLETQVAKAREIFPSSFAMGKRISPALAFARPLPWVGLHLSEQARNARYPNQQVLWREVFSPALAACRVLKEAHLPWVTINDLQLADAPPEAMKAIVLPWPEEITDSQRTAVEAFEERGGITFRLDPDAGWGMKSKDAALREALAAELHGKLPAPPVGISGPPKMHAVIFQKPGLPGYTVCLANTWGWFQTHRQPTAEDELPAVPPASCRNVRITLDADRFGHCIAKEVLSGADLEAQPSEGKNSVEITVPDFQINACVTIAPANR